MERTKLLIIVCSMMLAPFVEAETPDESWTVLRDESSITVYSRDVPNSKFSEWLAQTTINVRLSALVALIMDGNSHAQWIDSVDESRVLKVMSPTQSYIYTYSGAPWPIDDRDAVVLSSAKQDMNTFIVTIHSDSVPEYLSRQKDVVRVAYINSTWTLIPLKSGEVEVTYQVHNDPGGELPPWLINNLAFDQPYYTLENLHNFFKTKNKYTDIDLHFIKEVEVKTEQ